MYRYIEIAEEIEESYVIQKLKPGDRVDSVRDLCRTYKCHQSTATKALNYLKEKGFLYSIPQSGFYIAGGVDNESINNQFVDFKSSSPDARLFPYKDYQKCVNQAIEKNRSNLFEYSDMKGYEPLKKAIVKLVTDDFIFTDVDSIVVTTGIQQGLSILSEMHISNKKNKILIEQPSYHRFIEYLKLNSFDVVTVERTFEGIDLIEIERLFSEGEIKFFYTMPRVHNPLGTGLSKYEKEKLIQLAYKYDVLIIEDDYMADYITNNSNDPLISYDVKKTHVIYLRSFSKIIFPGLRVGFAILPKHLVRQVTEIKFYRDMGTSLLAQASLEIYLSNKMYDRQVAKMRKLYEKRAQRMFSVLKSHSINGGYLNSYNTPIIHTCINTGKRYSIRKLEQAGIKLADIKNYYYMWPNEPNKYMLINVSNVDENSIGDGFQRLLAALDKA